MLKLPNVRRCARACGRIAVLIGLIGGSLRVDHTPTAAQIDPFPRTLLDAAGYRITIPARPQTVGVLGDLPPLDVLLAPDAPLRLDQPPAPDDPRWDTLDLLIVSAFDGASYPALLDSARDRGVPVFRHRALTSLDDWRALVSRLGRATGRDCAAAAQRARLDARLSWLATGLAPAPPLRVLILTPEGYTFGQDTLITDLIAAAGAVNAAAAAGYDDFRQITDDAIRQLDPDVILLTNAWSRTALDEFRRQPAYASLSAVRQGRVLRLPFAATAPRDPVSALTALAFGLYLQHLLPIPGA